MKLLYLESDRLREKCFKKDIDCGTSCKEGCWKKSHKINENINKVNIGDVVYVITRDLKYEPAFVSEKHYHSAASHERPWLSIDRNWLPNFVGDCVWGEDFYMSREEALKKIGEIKELKRLEEREVEIIQQIETVDALISAEVVKHD